MSVDTQRVTLTVPAVPEYLRLARMASADAASRAGFDYEEIDDLRIAVSELCHLLIGTGGGGVLSLELSVADHGVTIDGHVTAPGESVENELASTACGGKKAKSDTNVNNQQTATTDAASTW